MTVSLVMQWIWFGVRGRTSVLSLMLVFAHYLGTRRRAGAAPSGRDRGIADVARPCF